MPYKNDITLSKFQRRICTSKFCCKTREGTNESCKYVPRKVKDAQAHEIASNEVSQKFGAGIEYQENVSFVEFFEAKLFEAMDAMTKNSVALIKQHKRMHLIINRLTIIFLLVLVIT